MTEVTRLYGWTERQLDAVAAKIAPVWADWLADWGVKIDAPLRCSAAEAGEQEAGWVVIAHEADRRAWLVAASAESLIGAALFGAHQPPKPSAASSVADQALRDLMNRLSAALKLEPVDRRPASDLPPRGAWSGTVLVALPFPRPLRLLLNAACVAAIAPATAAAAQASSGTRRCELVPLESAIARQLVRLKVELHACELDLGTLQALHVGDVVQLPHALDVPVQVLSAERQLLCAGYLGRLGSRKAIELVRSRNMKEETV